MASNWMYLQLKDVIDLVADNRGRNPESYSNEGIPVIDNYLIISEGYVNLNEVKRCVDERTYESFIRKHIQENDVLITLVGNGYGQVALTPSEKCVIIQNTIGLRCNSDNDNIFLYYLLKNNRKALMNLNIGAAQPSIKVGNLTSLEFQFPPLSEQKAIAHILGSLDDKIELNRQMNETLEAMTQALFKSWFVDFDPVIDNALAAGNAIPDTFAKRAEQRKGIEKKDHSDTQNLFPDEFEFTDEMGWIPKGWSVGVVEDVVKRLKSKKSYNKKDVLEHGEVPVYEQGAKILLGYHNNEPDIEAQINEPAFIFGDHTCVNKLSLEPFSISSNVIPLIGKLYPTLWVYYAVKDKQSFEEYRRHWMEFIIKSVILPSLKVTELFSENIKSFQVKQMKMQHQNSDLAKLRDTLLPKLMSGELRIPDAEALVDEAV